MDRTGTPAAKIASGARGEPASVTEPGRPTGSPPWDAGRAKAFGGALERVDFAIDAGLADAPGDELGDLRAEVDDQHLVVAVDDSLAGIRVAEAVIRSSPSKRVIRRRAGLRNAKAAFLNGFKRGFGAFGRGPARGSGLGSHQARTRAGMRTKTMYAENTDVARMIAGRAKLAELSSLFSPGANRRRPCRRRRVANCAARCSPRPRRRRSSACSGGRAAVMPGRARRLPAGAVELMLRERAIGAARPARRRTRLHSPDGLCGVAEDLSVATMMDAYEGAVPLLASRPDEMVGQFARRRVARPAERRLANVDSRGEIGATVIFDRDFEEALCDEASDAPTPPRLKWAFARLFDAGFAHSFDVVARSGGDRQQFRRGCRSRLRGRGHASRTRRRARRGSPPSRGRWIARASR